MNEISIRDRITAEDIANIIERHRVIYKAEFDFDPTFGDYVARTILERTAYILIAERDGIFIGCIGLVEIDDETAQLRWLLVEPSARGSGVAKANI